MGLQITKRVSGNVTILDLQGRMIIGSGNDALALELRKLAEAGPSEVLVNLAHHLEALPRAIHDVFELELRNPGRIQPL